MDLVTGLAECKKKVVREDCASTHAKKLFERMQKSPFVFFFFFFFEYLNCSAVLVIVHCPCLIRAASAICVI